MGLRHSLATIFLDLGVKNDCFGLEKQKNKISWTSLDWYLSKTEATYKALLSDLWQTKAFIRARESNLASTLVPCALNASHHIQKLDVLEKTPISCSL